MIVTLFSLAIASFVSSVVLAHDVAHDQGRASPPAAQAAMGPKEQAAHMFFGDRHLITQDGREVALYSDVLKNNVVLISFVFTNCTDSCPTQSAKLAEVQGLVGTRNKRDVRLLSISVDPERDTPKVLAEYAAHFNAGKNWLFLTGDKAAVDDVLRRLGQLAPDPRAHSALFIVGNVATGHWLRVHPDATPSFIATTLNALAAED